MPTTLRPYRLLLLSRDVREWRPSGHPAHHVSDLVDALDLSAFYAPYEGDSRRNAPYEPSMMVKVLIDAYATGVFSSRAIARKLEEAVAFQVLGAGNFPRQRTICEFRRRHLEAFERMFVAVVRVAREMGVVRLGTLSVYGTKERANARKRKAMSYGRMLKEEARLEAAQPEADEARGRQSGQDRNPKGGRPYKRAYGEPEPKAQSNFTDPESQIMKTSTERFQQRYNAQMVVDEAHQFIVATDVEAQASDQERMLPWLDGVSERFGAEPQVVLADAGYCNEADLMALEQRGIDGHVALGHEGKAQAAAHARTRPATHRMGEQLASDEGRARYAKRKWLPEAPNGWIKEVPGFRRFSLRGVEKVRGEWHLVCLALNIKRLRELAAC